MGEKSPSLTRSQSVKRSPMAFKMKKWHLNRGLAYWFKSDELHNCLEILRIPCPVQRSQIRITTETRGLSDTVC